MYGHLTIWADVDPVPNLPSAPVAANLASGGRGQDAGLDFRSYTLWFPVELDIIVTAVRFTLAWPEAGIENKVMLLHRSQLVAAADKAIDLTPPTAGS